MMKEKKAVIGSLFASDYQQNINRNDYISLADTLFLPQNSIVNLVGDSGVGKTRLSMKVAIEALLKNVSVIYCVTDTTASIDIYISNFIKIVENIKNNSIKERVKSSNIFFTDKANELDKFVMSVAENVNKESDDKNILLIIDTLTMFCASIDNNGDINDANFIANIYNNFRNLANNVKSSKGIDMTTLVIHHLNKQGLELGSGNIKNSVLIQYIVQNYGKNKNNIQIATQKNNSSYTFNNLKINISKMYDDIGEVNIKAQNHTSIKPKNNEIHYIQGNSLVMIDTIPFFLGNTNTSKEKMSFVYKTHYNGNIAEEVVIETGLSLTNTHRNILDAVLKDLIITQKEVKDETGDSFIVNTAHIIPYRILQHLGHKQSTNYKWLKEKLIDIGKFTFNINKFDIDGRSLGSRNVIRFFGFDTSAELAKGKDDPDAKWIIEFDPRIINLYLKNSLINYSTYYDLLRDLNNTYISTLIRFLFQNKEIVFSINEYLNSDMISSLNLSRQRQSEIKNFFVKNFIDVKDDDDTQPNDELPLEYINDIENIIDNADAKIIKKTLKELGIINVKKEPITKKSFDIIIYFKRPAKINYFSELDDNYIRKFAKNKISKTPIN